ncbi:pentapeptide repeat-containing protein [Lysinibacillus sphaericus]|uniref:Pentapeptide repeat-containing protein n=1 Tax=Lysinibacillus sphaericus OT4b.31 TaxID=1285586 RepID=R7Z8T3_LYSSH|nr:pentapeptide repeat-containing protein [Lysinibacillus sphaericus]EON70518.1 pentapeptide repeat-containing protein [Lysinibacillus sphaericus OT4b.31]
MFGEKIKGNTAKKMRESLQADCQNCFGLCCTALNIVASSDFAMNKAAGTPCQNLQADYSCHIHSSLREKGFKGCTVFDCLGAGQMVSQTTFGGQDWRKNPQVAAKMFRVFPIMEQLYEMIAYLAEALSYEVSSSLSEKLNSQLAQLQQLTRQDADTLLVIDIMKYRMPVNALLLATSEQIRLGVMAKACEDKNKRKYNFRGVDWVGKNLKGKNLTATDLRGAYLIAANLQNTDLRGVDFIGADLRDAELSGANLSTSMFLTQMQINSAKGNSKTILPGHLKRPSHWND